MVEYRTHGKHVFSKHLRSSSFHVPDTDVFIKTALITYAACLIRYEQNKTKNEVNDVCLDPCD